VLDRLRRRVLGISARLALSYVFVTLAVVVLVEALVLGYQAPRLVDDAQLQARVMATAKTYVGQLLQRYPGGAVPPGTLLGESGQPPTPGQTELRADGMTLVVPAVAGPLRSSKAVTAAVVVAADGTVVASSAPSRYPPGHPVAGELPAGAATALVSARSARVGGTGSGSTPDGPVSWALLGLPGPGTKSTARPSGTARYLYVQAPEATGFVNPVRAWDEVRQLSGAGPLLSVSYVLLIAIVPVGVAVGLLASRRLVRRVRRLERATVAVADGDYSVTLPSSSPDELGRLEANFTTMARQLGSALASERERATADARVAERSRIAREIHDAISQHLFGLRMIAAGMRKADPGNKQAQAVEHIAEEALREMQALLLELRPVSHDGLALAPALERICASYHDRLGVAVSADLEDVAVPEPVRHALVRIAQEACANAFRHGHARQLNVSVARRDGYVELAVRDTGTGFDPATVRTGSGLRHIRDRARELGGTVDIDSVPGRGAAVIVCVPVP
jgi:signal transduction histidine kinase/predicted regulator of Ras-like GTPase activity (Roadblock/LC7/MglB family)